MIEATTNNSLTVWANPARPADGANQFGSFQETLQGMEEDFLRRFPQATVQQVSVMSAVPEPSSMNSWARSAPTLEKQSTSAANPPDVRGADTSASAAVRVPFAFPELMKAGVSTVNAWASAPLQPPESGAMSSADSDEHPLASEHAFVNEQRWSSECGAPAGVHVFTVADGIAFSVRTGQSDSSAAVLAAWIRQRLQARGAFVAQSHIDGVARHYLPQTAPSVNTRK